MGDEIAREHFDEADYDRFSEKLTACTRALGLVLERPGFGEGASSLGAELELSLVNGEERPAFVNRAVLSRVTDPRVTLELDRFNMEINATPFPLRGRPFTATARDFAEALDVVRAAARECGAHAVAIGILPTLREGDLTSSALTQRPRYRALSAGLRRVRGEPFPLRIEGEDELDLLADDVTYEGANTSFQVHLRTPPAAFAATYNAAQLATSVALAASGNSPLLLGRRLWDETRIALFRQSVDDRTAGTSDELRPARVSFGHGWVRRGPLELFEEVARMHEPLIPLCSDEDPLAVARSGGVPTLAELRLHNGTVWRWNRAVYDAAEGGHVRIELRALPAGPTVRDMMANAAFVLGLTLGLRPRADELLSQITFGQARRNFYEAAKKGLDAELLWPASNGLSPRLVGARELARDLAPVARRGLVDEGVEPEEADSLLAIIEGRVETGLTGARWQRRVFEALLRATGDRDEAARALVARYRALSDSDAPVHTWPVE